MVPLAVSLATANVTDIVVVTALGTTAYLPISKHTLENRWLQIKPAKTECFRDHSLHINNCTHRDRYPQNNTADFDLNVQWLNKSPDCNHSNMPFRQYFRGNICACQFAVVWTKTLFIHRGTDRSAGCSGTRVRRSIIYPNDNTAWTHICGAGSGFSGGAWWSCCINHRAAPLTLFDFNCDKIVIRNGCCLST